METNGTFTKLHDFKGSDGNNPETALVVGPDGALYGSTYGGTNGNGTLFRVETNGVFTKLYDFNYVISIFQPLLVSGPDGVLYGSTYFGGTNGEGTLFRLQANGAFTKLYDFNDTDGGQPYAALVVGPGGALYGSTAGELFRLETNSRRTRTK